MRWVFAAVLILGMLMLVAWVMLRASKGRDFDSLLISRGPQVIAAAVAFGMGGLSAAYAGWNLGPATLAAAGAAALAAWYAGTGGQPGGKDQS